MLKTVKLLLNDFPSIPASLCTSPGGAIASEIAINLADLYHHYYLDSWNIEPPDPDPAHFEHVRYLLRCKEFRFSRQGLGAARTFKGNKSNELGQAFCRWFLSEHLDINYIAHIEHVRDHAALADYGGVTVTTSVDFEGDGPDYFCASSSNDIYLGEAKGTRHAVGFKTREFQKWRDQFKRVRILDAALHAISVKGYIVAMRWTTESDSARVATTLSAEDPVTLGDRPAGRDQPGIAYATKAINYASSLRRLRQPLVAAALLRGFTLPDELKFSFVVWECLLPPLGTMRFAGGYFPEASGRILPFKLSEHGAIIYTPIDPMRLDIATGTFVGIELSILKTLVATARLGPSKIRELGPLDRPEVGYSGVSLLRDGHMIGPVEFFRPVQFISL